MTAGLPKTITIGGGKGGAGRSTVALGLARALCQRGWKVLLVDADTVCPTSHLWLGMSHATPPRGSGIGDPNCPLAPFVRHTPLPNLALLTFAFARGYPYVRPRLNAPSIIERLLDLNFDTCIIDLPAGHDPVWVSLLALSQCPILVTTADISGVANATQHIRAALFHGLGFHPSCYDIEEELLMLLRDQDLEMSQASLEPPFLSSLGRRVVRETRTAMTPALILNKVRTNNGGALSSALSMAWGRLLNVAPRALGQIPLDNAYAPLEGVADPPPGKLEAALADIARALEDYPVFLDRHPRPIAAPNSPHGLLGLTPAVPHPVVSMRLKGARELLTEDAPFLRVLLDSRGRDELLAAIARAQDELSPPDPSRPRLLDPVHAPPPAASVIPPTTPDPGLAAPAQPPPLPSTAPRAHTPLTALLTDASAPIPAPAEAIGAEPDDYTADALVELDLDPPGPTPRPEPTPNLTPPEEADAPTPRYTPLSALGTSSTGSPAPDEATPDLPATASAGDSIIEIFADDDPPATSMAPLAASGPAKSTPTSPARSDSAESPGHFLQTVRRNSGMSTRELSLRTKIGIKYLLAIEAVDRPALPRPVYLRGYLREIAQVFKLDDTELIRRYFSYLGYP